MSELQTVYRTTNLITGEFYIGIHGTNQPEDNYLGSGSKLLASIEKHGYSNFRKEILFSFEDRNQAFAKEVELIKLHSNDPLCLNVHPGGKGGWIKGHKKSEETKAKMRKPKSEETKAKMRKPKSAEARENMKGRLVSTETREKIGRGNTGKTRAPISEETRKKISEAGLGKIHSEETKRLMSEAHIRRWTLRRAKQA